MKKTVLFLFSLIQFIMFALPVQAATRNDALLDLKDSLNSPVSENNSAIAIIMVLLVCGVVILLLYYNSTQKKKAQLDSHKSYQEKKHSQKPNSQQKRNWFRLKTRGEFEWLPIELADDLTKDHRFKKDHLVDVSGGGLCFSTAEPINKFDEIRVLLSLGERNPLSLTGQVIRVVEDAGVNTVSVEFIGIRDGQRDKIVTWILNNQRSSMQNEKPEETTPTNAG